MPENGFEKLRDLREVGPLVLDQASHRPLPMRRIGAEPKDLEEAAELLVPVIPGGIVLEKKSSSPGKRNWGRDDRLGEPPNVDGIAPVESAVVDGRQFASISVKASQFTIFESPHLLDRRASTSLSMRT